MKGQERLENKLNIHADRAGGGGKRLLGKRREYISTINCKNTKTPFVYSFQCVSHTSW